MLAHANTRAERRYRDRTGLTRARLALLVAIKSYQLTHYGYGPSHAWVATFMAENLSHATPFALHELRRVGLICRGEGLVVLGYVLTERGEAKVVELMAREAGAAE